jgi:hypothetical protein
MMKAIIKYIGLISVILFFFSVSCDKIEEPYKVVNNNQNPDTTDTGNVFVKKILIEDFTGHRCGNCPEAHEILHTLEATYPGQVIGIGLHVGWFASTTIYPTDYTTTTGNELNTFFGAETAGLPTGCVSRVEDQGSKLITPSKWSTIASQVLLQQPNVGITIDNDYNASNRTVDITVDVTVLESITNDLFLTLYVVEDSCISEQLDYNSTPQDITDYAHRHVLRDAVNTTWGEEIFTGGAVTDDTVQKTFTYTLNSAWNEDNCSIIAFVYDETTLEIYQAEDKHVVDH